MFTLFFTFDFSCIVFHALECCFDNFCTFVTTKWFSCVTYELLAIVSIAMRVHNITLSYVIHA